MTFDDLKDLRGGVILFNEETDEVGKVASWVADKATEEEYDFPWTGLESLFKVYASSIEVDRDDLDEWHRFQRHPDKASGAVHGKVASYKVFVIRELVEQKFNTYLDF